MRRQSGCDLTIEPHNWARATWGSPSHRLGGFSYCAVFMFLDWERNPEHLELLTFVKYKLFYNLTESSFSQINHKLWRFLLFWYHQINFHWTVCRSAGMQLKPIWRCDEGWQINEESVHSTVSTLMWPFHLNLSTCKASSWVDCVTYTHIFNIPLLTCALEYLSHKCFTTFSA